MSVMLSCSVAMASATHVRALAGAAPRMSALTAAVAAFLPRQYQLGRSQTQQYTNAQNSQFHNNLRLGISNKTAGPKSSLNDSTSAPAGGGDAQIGAIES
jgi:hypothetical protein